MRVPISDYAFLDLDAPTLAAYAVPHETGVAWGIWCKYCATWHFHGIGEGHCQRRTPYTNSGYNLAFAGDCESFPEPPENC